MRSCQLALDWFANSVTKIFQGIGLGESKGLDSGEEMILTGSQIESIQKRKRFKKVKNAVGI